MNKLVSFEKKHIEPIEKFVLQRILGFKEE
jgi:hypothetical protein